MMNTVSSLAVLSAIICVVHAQSSPMYNHHRMFDVNTFRSMFPFRNDKTVPFQMSQAQRYIPLLKKSDARWEDLGWAWGKRSETPGAPGAQEEAVDRAPFERQARSLKQVKKNPDWHDLGWAWGRK